ncbi:unnamed protein product [Candidula unifasciata]|uniref:3-phosphoinositide-dependent protein kinase 1 n=1 Tax=Candidula unifasciata TaxID=100452 RepID=A0A8S3ZLT9_9EUPU|nr:unnamed protein product [Candidula unifasciata]
MDSKHTSSCQTADVHSHAFPAHAAARECTDLANSHNSMQVQGTKPHDANFSAELCLQKPVLGRNIDKLTEYVDTENKNVSYCHDAVENTTSCDQLVSNIGAENSECKALNGANSGIYVDSDRDSAEVVSEADSRHPKTTGNTYSRQESGNQVPFGPRSTSLQGIESVVPVKGFVSAALSEADTTGGNDTFKSGQLTNQLIEGPRITLPPSQLPVKPAYSSPYTHNQIQQKASADAANFTSVKSTVVTTVPATGEQITAKLSEAEAAAAARAKAKRTPNDFVFGKVIGEGSYSTVYLAKEVSTQRQFAIKVCDKKHLIRERKTHFVMREKEVLMKLDHSFFIKLAYTFQDSERLYYVLTYACHGELLGYLHKLSAFDVPCTRFYSAEIVLALEYLHGLGIIHRDLKPENILLSEDMHIKITDFGTSKILSTDSEGKAENQVEAKRKNSFVGTAEYVSPEVLNNQPANFGSDLWALGCIIYQCLSGSLPFRSGNEYQTFQKIVKAEYEFPEGFNPDAKDLVQKLLVVDPALRLGMAKPEGMKALKNHKFYEGIDWETLPDSTPPKLMPYLPATAHNPEFWGQEQRTGFDDQRFAEIITGQCADGSMSPELEEVPVKALTQAEDAERAEKLRKQRLENPFHQFVKDNLIIKQGFVDKRKGLFARKRMLLLTEGPHLYYVDAHNKVLKGEIPWSKYLRPEAKNFKIFFVHTPNRTYYLESRQPDAQDWVKQIKEVWKRYYENVKDK